MRWNSKTAAVSKLWDTRISRRFAFLPVLLEDGQNVWLEMYSVEHRCEEVSVAGFDGTIVYTEKQWVPIRKFAQPKT